MGKYISIKQYRWSHLQHPPDLHAFLHTTLNAYKITPSIIAAVQQLLGLTLSKKSIYSIECEISTEVSSLGNRVSGWVRMLQSETETKNAWILQLVSWLFALSCIQAATFPCGFSFSFCWHLASLPSCHTQCYSIIPRFHLNYLK